MEGWHTEEDENNREKQHSKSGVELIWGNLMNVLESLLGPLLRLNLPLFQPFHFASPEEREPFQPSITVSEIGRPPPPTERDPYRSTAIRK